MRIGRLPRGGGPHRPRRLLVRLAILVLVLALALAAYVAWPRPAVVERAVGLLPAGTQRVTFTDWTGVRAELGDRFDDEVGGSDLGAASVALGAATTLEEGFGWGPSTIAWEALGQGEDGQVLVVDLGEGADIAKLATSYAGQGYADPGKGRLDGAVWAGGAEALGRTGLTEAIFGNAAILGDEHLLLLSDSPDFLTKAVKDARDGKGLDFAPVRQVEGALAAVGFVGDLACERLSFASADPGAQAEAESLVAEAGGVAPLDGYLVALGAEREWTAVFRYESEDQATRDSRSRQALAGADDPGQMESYRDLFTVDAAEVEGRDVVLRGRAAQSAYAMTETTSGPVLLASC